MRTALIHEWFTNEGGAEKVTDEILKILNDEVTIFSLLNYSRKSVNNYSHPKNKIRVSYLQYLTSKNSNYRLLLPLFPMAIRQYELRTYDLVISSSHLLNHLDTKQVQSLFHHVRRKSTQLKPRSPKSPLGLQHGTSFVESGEFPCKIVQVTR